MKKPNGKPTPKALALRRWNCESIEQMANMIARGERMIAEMKQQQLAEGQEKFNIALMKPGFRWSEEINGITYLVRTQWDNMPEVIARVNNREVGRATFIDHHTRSGLESVSTYVSPKWQGHGIAKNMYAVIRMLGANIQPSATQTDMGKDMWAKWKKGGDTKHLTSMNAKTDQQGVAEEGYGNDPSQRVDPRTGKKYVPPKSPLGQGVAEGSLEEKWTRKYKNSINCSNPKGFSQKAHCAGKKK
jgi:GNAT superfamily N-acetyltransferase